MNDTPSMSTNEAARILGRRGGIRRRDNMTPAERVKAATKASRAAARKRSRDAKARRAAAKQI